MTMTERRTTCVQREREREREREYPMTVDLTGQDSRECYSLFAPIYTRVSSVN